MFEVAVLFVAMVIVGACIFTPSSLSAFFNKKAVQPSKAKVTIPEDSTLRRHFLAEVRAKIESNFHPRPTDAVLKRHHDSLIASEINKYLGLCAA
ncbi:MAG: hypothetical protein GQ569_06750 [Methylococcaceae bacterium]|nr:hypothetical protein [Methylococcaceae bacterium]